MTAQQIRVLLVDDQPLVRAGLRTILTEESDMTVVGDVEDGADVAEVVRRCRPDVILMDIRMPRIDGVTATAQLTHAGEPARVLMLTTFDLDEHVYAALRAGAVGFLLKDAPAQQIVDAIRIAQAGNALLAPSTTKRLIERFLATSSSDCGPTTDTALQTLTDREREVLTLIATGRSNHEIAKELILGEATIKTHVSRVLAKLQLRDRTQAVIYAYEVGLISPRS